MHELAITQGLYDVVIREAEKIPAKKVCNIYLKLGKWYDYVPEIMQEYFDLLAEGSIAEGALLEVEWVPVTVHCASCGYKGDSIFGDRCCPQCGKRSVRLLTGKEFYIENMEIEEE